MMLVGLPPPSTEPTMVSVSVTSTSPLTAMVSVSAIWVRVIVHGGSMIVSAPGIEFALITAWRRLQEEEVSEVLMLLHVKATVASAVLAVGSSNRFTKKVGSGRGAIVFGWDTLFPTMTRPERRSVLTRTANTPTGASR